MSIELQIAAGIGLLIWAGVPWGRLIKSQRVVMGLHILKGVVPVALVRSGVLEGWSETVTPELLGWGVGFLTVWVHSLSAVHQGSRARAVGVTAGALLIIQPIACAVGVVSALTAWRIQRGTPESAAWIEVAGVLGAAAGVLTVSIWNESLWIGAIWWILLLQKQVGNLELILVAQNRAAKG